MLSASLSDIELGRMNRAVEIIDGIDTEGKPDWQHLKPDVHARNLPMAAAPLRRIIESRKVMDLVDERRTASREASRAQALSRLYFHLTIMPFMLATSLAVWLAVSYLGLTALQEEIVQAVIGLGLLVGGLVTVFATLKAVAGVWKANRNTAETLRRDIFYAIAAASDVAQPGEIDATPLQLEYFRRFQLAAQIDYYGTRIREQGVLADRTSWWRRCAVVLFGLLLLELFLMLVGSAGEQGKLTGIAGATAFLGWLEANSIDTWILTVLLGCNAVFVFSWLAAIQLGDHRSLYGEALAGLMAIQATELEPARHAAARGDPALMKRLVAHVHEVMRREHTVWLGV